MTAAAATAAVGFVVARLDMPRVLGSVIAVLSLRADKSLVQLPNMLPAPPNMLMRDCITNKKSG